MSERFIQAGEVRLCTEAFGKNTDPAILLIMGAQSSMIWWDRDFCRRLADTGHYVIRYDNRDTGRSTAYPPGQPDYTFEDMADDAIHILDAYGIAKAHFAGMSMGGLLGQIIALRHPERVSALTLIMTSNFAPHLPEMDGKVMKFFMEHASLNWSDRDAVVRFSLGKWKMLAGSKYPLDEDRTRILAREELERWDNPESMNNHGLVTGGESYLTRTSDIAVPTQVIHGTEDPIIPYPHGVHLAEAIPGAFLITLEGVGHELPKEEWNTLIDAISTFGQHPAL
ncbi:alpha/beta fold hydrolase [Paenibacillus sp. DMB20]|uniref:alpha/beta fold hydrolase n=1 Tax=Paenibacillus sp. DMB20 TaxID=1642570 RepID=UPI000627A1D1|nr:alpha/beta hydrolase [Paenibacillus sp. DMB20]KKO53951.1 acetyltransferase [Paenibacillus sp. DMB20]